eukprot:6181388-Pleurochrysis_carterae.AAC.2
MTLVITVPVHTLRACAQHARCLHKLLRNGRIYVVIDYDDGDATANCSDLKSPIALTNSRFDVKSQHTS